MMKSLMALTIVAILTTGCSEKPTYYYTFDPKDDITTLELAKSMSIIVYALASTIDEYNPLMEIENLPPNIRRHFTKHLRQH